MPVNSEYTATVLIPIFLGRLHNSKGNLTWFATSIFGTDMHFYSHSCEPVEQARA
jgi:hypothetical protein